MVWHFFDNPKCIYFYQNLFIKCLIWWNVGYWQLPLCVRYKSTHTMWKSKNDKTVLLLLAKVLGGNYFLGWVYIHFDHRYMQKKMYTCTSLSSENCVTSYWNRNIVIIFKNMRNKLILSKCVKSLLLGCIFNDNDRIHAYQYMITIKWSQSNRGVKASVRKSLK